MSGPMSPAVAEAAKTHALQAEAAAAGLLVRELVVQRAKAAIAERSKHAVTGSSLPARTWAAIPLPTRQLLVVLASDQAGEPERISRQPWDSFSTADQCRLGAAARSLSRDLRFASSLF